MPRHNYMQHQPHLTSRIRSILVDWLVEVAMDCHCFPETLYLAVNILDRYLGCRVVCRNRLQLVGITAMLLALLSC